MSQVPDKMASGPAPAPRALSTVDVFCWRVLIWGLGLSTPLLTSLKPRRFIAGELDVAEGVGDLSYLASKGFYLLFLILATVALFRHLSSGDKSGARGRGFWGLTILLAALPTVSTLVSGGTLTLSLLGTLAIYSATYFMPTPSLEWLVRQLRVMLMCVFVYGSLAVAVLFPDWAWNPSYAEESALALFPMRLYGMAAHANSLAPLAIFVWMLGRFPGCRLRGEPVHVAAIVLVLLLSQSKTNLVLAVLLCCAYLLIRLNSLGRFKRYLGFSVIASSSALFLVYLFKFSSYASRIEDMMYDPQIITLSGRVPLWLLAVDMWLERPWFGQGLDAWSSKASLDYFDFLGWAATHAHNQILQVLSQTGLVGLAALLLWSRSFYRIVRAVPDTVRIPLYWTCAFYFLPGFTEVIFQYTLGQGATLLTWMLSVMVLYSLRIYSRPVTG